MGRVVEVEWEVADVADKVVEFGVACLDVAEFDDSGTHVGGEGIAQRSARHADDGELLGQEVRLKEVKVGGQQLAPGEIAGGSEDDKNPRIGDPLGAFGKLGEILGADCHLHGGHGENNLRRGRTDC